MAFMNQELKKKLTPAIKAVLKKHGMKGSIAVRHHSTLVVNIANGPLPFIHENEQINQHNPNVYGAMAPFLTELVKAMSEGNHDNSDIMTDYFDVGWYININVGQWNKPYVWNKPVTGRINPLKMFSAMTA